jgi:solute carrier family 20 (sodium-dependent phosphate transporter)
VLIAAIFEFAGAVLVGNNVAESIRGRIINVSLFGKITGGATALQLGMVCALMGSSTWLMFATKMGWPVSTTHSIIGAVLGMGIAAFGPGVVNWEYNTGRGFGGIVASWFISIAVSGVMAGVLYLFMKYAILRYKNSFQRSLVFGPVVFGLTYGIMSLSLVWKGTPKLKLDKIPDSDVIAIVLGVWAVSAVLTYFWISLPLKRQHWDGHDVQAIDFLLGPFAPTRPIRAGFDASHVGDKKITESLWNNELDPEFARVQAEIAAYNAEVERQKEEAKLKSSKAVVAATTASAPVLPSKTFAGDNVEAGDPSANGADKASSLGLVQTAASTVELAELRARLAKYEGADVDAPRREYEREWKKEFASADLARKVYLLARYVLCWGIDGRAIVENTAADSPHLKFAPKWESKTESMYITLNVITSCIQSFAHGSNDVANAIGPLSTIYFVYQNNKVPGTNAAVELWQLAFGAAGIVLGLWFYGFNIMRALGNNLTYQSPSRGFCMDVGSAITVLIASKEGFPISTTQCITGATVGVGIANGEWRAVNWWLFAKIFAGWAVTLPVAGTIAGVIYAFIAYGPRLPHDPKQF